MQKNIYGKKNEIIAADFLKSKGYQIIETNYKNKIGEIDIIAKDKDYLVFVEVKARFSRMFGDPTEAVNYTKQQKIRAVASLYLIISKQVNANCRFDVVAVLGDNDCDIRHIKDEKCCREP